MSFLERTFRRGSLIPEVLLALFAIFDVIAGLTIWLVAAKAQGVRHRVPFEIATRLFTLFAFVAAVVAWIELWFSAVHDVGRYVNGGIVAAWFLVAYVIWRIPLGKIGTVPVRLLGVCGSAFGQWALLRAVEEPWRLWH